MQIAPGIDASEWTGLQLDGADSPDWKRAIAIFRRRIDGRFIDPVDHLVALELPLSRKERRFGFAVLAIDCLLVETLQAFWQGLERTDRRSEEMFQNFLTRSAFFAPPFNQDLASRFWRQFRCGILHQAEIGGDSLVVSEGPLIAEKRDALVVNRNEFHANLKKELESYSTLLARSDSAGLRGGFRTKMSYIARSTGAA